MDRAFDKLRSPVGTKLRETTPLRLVCSAATAAAGVYAYRAGYTYEGSLAVYLLPTCILGWPYLMSVFRWPLPVLGALGLMPVLVVIQNGGVQAGNWIYPENKRFLLGHITEQGDGPLGWTRLLWTGTQMPAIEYLFYPLMATFMLCSFALFLSFAPKSLHVESRSGKGLFVALFAAMIVFFLVLRVQHDRPVMDHNWYLIGVGFANGVAALLLSPSFRRLISLRAWWVWLAIMGCGVQPLWEFTHSCVNHDWVYDAERVMPIMYVYNGAPISVLEPLGYLGVSITFPALVCLLRDMAPGWVLRGDAQSGTFGHLLQPHATDGRQAPETVNLGPSPAGAEPPRHAANDW